MGSGNYVLPAVRAKGVYLDSNKTLNEVFYPVGSIFQSTSSTSPASLYGGSWERIEGRFLLGTSSSYSVSSTGGEAEHTLSIDEMPSHQHTYFNDKPPDENTNEVNPGYYSLGANNYTMIGSYQKIDLSTPAGGDQSHNNMPPYYSAYIWRRVA